MGEALRNGGDRLERVGTVGESGGYLHRAQGTRSGEHGHAECGRANGGENGGEDACAAGAVFGHVEHRLRHKEGDKGIGGHEVDASLAARDGVEDERADGGDEAEKAYAIHRQKGAADVAHAAAECGAIAAFVVRLAVEAEEGEGKEERPGQEAGQERDEVVPNGFLVAQVVGDGGLAEVEEAAEVFS